MSKTKIHGMAIHSAEKLSSEGFHTFTSQQNHTTIGDDGTVKTVPVETTFFATQLGRSENAVMLTAKMTADREQKRKDSVTLFEEKIKHYQTIFNTSSDEYLRGLALGNIADMLTCAGYSSRIAQNQKDGKEDHVKLLIKLCAEYTHYRKCYNALEIAKLYARSCDYDKKGRPKKERIIHFEELDRILKEYTKSKHDNLDSSEIFVAISCALMEYTKENNGILDLFAEHTFTVPVKRVLKQGEKVTYKSVSERYLKTAFTVGRETIDSHASVKALENGFTYVSFEDEETKKKIYVKSAKYANMKENESVEETLFIKTIVDNCGLTDRQEDVLHIIAQYDGDISERDMADILGIDVSSVRDRLEGMRKKLFKLDGMLIKDGDTEIKINIKKHLDSTIDRWFESLATYDDETDRKEEQAVNKGFHDYQKRKAEKSRKESVIIPKESISKEDAWNNALLPIMNKVHMNTEHDVYIMNGHEYRLNEIPCSVGDKPIAYTKAENVDMSWTTDYSANYWKAVSFARMQKNITECAEGRKRIAKRLSTKAEYRQQTMERKHKH